MQWSCLILLGDVLAKIKPNWRLTYCSFAEEKVNALTKVASVKVAEASKSLEKIIASDAAAAAPTASETKGAVDAVKEAETALEVSTKNIESTISLLDAFLLNNLAARSLQVGSSGD